ncbi:MAG: hydrolase [Candidatus Omnitrophica bacterium]|nr:hydrolase [Candidatus Omnitrophota bacterium]
MPEERPGPRLATRNGAAFLIVDFQERFRPVIPNWGEILENLIRIARAAQVLRAPLIVTEQYPQGLGRTVPELEEHLEGAVRLEKVAFGCFREPKFVGKLKGLGVETLLITGIEAHVCVAQTALQALDEGYRTHLLADAVGSRNGEHVKIAMDRLRGAGAVISCTEMALFELLERAGTPEFKAIQRLVK